MAPCCSTRWIQMLLSQLRLGLHIKFIQVSLTASWRTTYTMECSFRRVQQLSQIPGEQAGRCSEYLHEPFCWIQTELWWWMRASITVLKCSILNATSRSRRVMANQFREACLGSEDGDATSCGLHAAGIYGYLQYLSRTSPCRSKCVDSDCHNSLRLWNFASQRW